MIIAFRGVTARPTPRRVHSTAVRKISRWLSLLAAASSSTLAASSAPRLRACFTAAGVGGDGPNLRPLSSEAGGGRSYGDLPSLAKRLAEGSFRDVVIVAGAGLSVAAGVPDFRSPKTGLYHQLERYNLPYPEAIFDLNFFHGNPAPFATFAREIWPGQTGEGGPRPTLGHAFLRLLQSRGALRRVYTQNIDGLERMAGLSESSLVECHGHFSSASCVGCREEMVAEECREAYVGGKKAPLCRRCGSLVKPDIVFFGEELPKRFVRFVDADLAECDLLIVLGTSLMVNPVASLPSCVGGDVPRLLINRELVGDFAYASTHASSSQDVSRDNFFEGDCDDGVRYLCELAGKDWVEDLKRIHDEVTS